MTLITSETSEPTDILRAPFYKRQCLCNKLYRYWLLFM